MVLFSTRARSLNHERSEPFESGIVVFSIYSVSKKYRNTQMKT
jgi:hypothetical protein